MATIQFNLPLRLNHIIRVGDQTSVQTRHKSDNERLSREVLRPKPGHEATKVVQYAGSNSISNQSRLCGDCDVLKYCQYARKLSHNHANYFNSQELNHGHVQDTFPILLDKTILAEKLKLRHKTCPFHRELSLG